MHETDTENRLAATLPLREFCERCKLDLLVGKPDEPITFTSALVNRPGLLFAGFVEYFGNHRVQIIGNAEHYYFRSLDEKGRIAVLDRLYSQHIPCVILTRGIEPHPMTLKLAEKYRVPVLRTELTTTSIVTSLSHYLDELLAPSTTLHGTLMDIGGTGVLITGHSGMGKSETALELVHRGHRLVADDAVQVKRVDDTLIGRSPDAIKFFMEVRGIGIIDVRSMFGVGSVLDSDDINLVIELEKWNNDKPYERLGDTQLHENVLGIDIPKLLIPVMPGRNLAIVVEVAARNYRLKQFGYDAVSSLTERAKLDR